VEPEPEPVYEPEPEPEPVYEPEPEPEPVYEPEPEPEPVYEPEPEPEPYEPDPVAEYEPVEDFGDPDASDDIAPVRDDEIEELDLEPTYREPLPKAPKESSGGTGLLVSGAVGVGLSAGAMLFAGQAAANAQNASNKDDYDQNRQMALAAETGGWVLGVGGVALIGTGAIVKAKN
jgi:hypothetical protein